MDNSQDPTNPDTKNELDVPMPSAIEPVEETPEDTESEDTTDEMNTDSTDDAEDEPAGYKSTMNRMELESLILRYMDDVEKLKSQIKSEKEMYNASFENDAAYSEATDVAKTAKQKVSEIKQRITQQPAVKDAEMRMSELKDEVKDVQEAISGLAEQYQQVAGTNQIVQDDGQVLEIVRNFKVIRKRS